MSYGYSPDAVNTAGTAFLGATSVVSGGIWFVGQVAEVPTSVVNAAGTNAITACVLTIAAMGINGYISIRKARLDNEQRIAAAVETTDRKVAEARQESNRKLLEVQGQADHRIATLEARLAVADQVAESASHARHQKMDQLYTMINGLFVHLQDNSNAINTLIPAVQENSARTGSAIPDVGPVASPFEKIPAPPSPTR